MFTRDASAGPGLGQAGAATPAPVWDNKDDLWRWMLYDTVKAIEDDEGVDRNELDSSLATDAHGQVRQGLSVCQRSLARCRKARALSDCWRTRGRCHEQALLEQAMDRQEADKRYEEARAAAEARLEVPAPAAQEPASPAALRTAVSRRCADRRLHRCTSAPRSRQSWSPCARARRRSTRRSSAAHASSRSRGAAPRCSRAARTARWLARPRRWV